MGAVAGAAAWAAIAAATGFQIGYMAVGVGFLAGFGMRTCSGHRGRTNAIVAGVVALLGCLLGNTLTAVVGVAQHEHFPIPLALLTMSRHLGAVPNVIAVTFEPMDLLFYGIAVFTGYRTALAVPKARPALAQPARTGASEPDPAP